MFHLPLGVNARMSVGAFADAGAVFCCTLAYAADSSGFVGLVSYIQIAYAFLADLLIFKANFRLI